MAEKRKFPYHSAVASFAVSNKRQDLGRDAGTEAKETRIFEQPNYGVDNYGDPRAASGTDFTKWSPAEIKEFLDQRGGDYDDCQTLEQLVDRAIEVEINTGPARPPRSASEPVSAEPGDTWAQAVAAHASNGTAGASAAAEAGGGGEDDEYDPLDAFMQDIDTKVKAELTQQPKAGAPAAAAAGGGAGGKKRSKADLQCDEEYDAAEYMMMRKGTGAAAAAATAASGYDSDEEVYAAARAAEAAAEKTGMQYDSDDNPILDDKKKKKVDELAPLDHSEVDYPEFNKEFYEEGPELFAMDDAEVAAYRRSLDIRVSGFDPPKPVKEFNQCGFDDKLMGAIQKAGYERPTAIQAQALPAVLSGRDVLGIAKTGSGKTAAFVLPMLVHIMDQPELGRGEGPIGVVVAPTRELAEQIHKETRKFARVYNLRIANAIGGLNKYDQLKELKAGAEAVVCTPGRLIDHIKDKACTMRRATYLVLDEADRMFDLGFEPQVRSIVGQIRPDRQTLLFSATMPKKVAQLVTDVLTDPITITVGTTGVANADIRQLVEVVADDAAKLRWLVGHVQEFIDEGEVIVFANQKAKVEAVVAELVRAGAKAAAIHGDMDQFTRMKVLESFREGKHHVLVATDVAARGLDIKTLKTVVNYDAAKDMDTHIHRVGRTGRAGDKEGIAWTLLLPTDTGFAVQLLQSLALGLQSIPSALHELAMKDKGHRRGGGKGGRGGGRGRGKTVGGAGLGFGSSHASSTGPGAPGAPPPPPAGVIRGGMASFAPASTSGASGLPGPPAASKTFVELPGFARAHDMYEQESSAAAAVRGPPASGANAVPLPPPPPLPEGGLPAALAASQGLPAPPPPMFPGSSSSANASSSMPPASAGAPAPTERRRGGWDAGAAAPPTLPPPPATQPAQQQQQQQGTSAPDSRDEARDFVRTMHESRFKSSFVSSGVSGGTTNSGVTIVAPKVQSTSKPLAPPPVPVTEQPLYMTRGGFSGASSSRGFSRGPGFSGQPVAGTGFSSGFDAPRNTNSTTSYHSQPPPSALNNAPQAGAQSAAAQAAAAAAAIAAAQAIAARLASQAPK